MIAKDKFIGVGGGIDGEYVVTIVDGDKSVDLAIEDEPGHLLAIPVGGQDVEIPSNRVVDRATAKKALEHYLENGKPSPELLWLRTE